ncbi:MAG: DUF2007 domain-containing protein [Planctomycetota bacterium]
MTPVDADFAVLLEGVDHVAVSLAKNVLEQAGIPCLGAGPDFDIIELGQAVHDMVRGRRLLVARRELARARALLVAAWGEDVPGLVPAP